MEGPERSLSSADRLYRGHVGTDIYPLVTISKLALPSQVLKCPFKLGKIERPGSYYSVITQAQIQVQGKLMKVVFKTYRRINDTTATKVAQVGAAYNWLSRRRLTAAQRTYREVVAWVILASSSGRCDNINQFHGVCFADPRLIPEAFPGIPSIVTDYVKYGSLEYTEGQDFGLKLDIVRQLANGLSFMHSLNVIHGDIKPDNFRVTEDGIVKIIDLGLSREETIEHTGLTTTIHPSYLFLAPELIIPDEDDISMFVTKASDVYAFSMTALQILDGRGYASRPFNHRQGPYPVRKAIVTQQWPQQQQYPGVIPQAWKIVSACWTSEPSIRPSIDALLADLSAVSLL
ncbi:hypothetical protein EST38_g3955 [Candolleomyces aberdarensis]|uniref:Protein kinase domain-containing protein n=1 Tax=Candolleomyces aberdarensis TaxID=2316362 RepID=A0A4Q2DS75_9AGAR|nr:hypothetical protein EST38_g3955 [Candolleomyces aberdarensis]